MATKKKSSYLGNPHLKKVGVPVSLTEQDVREYIKCRDDPVYFAQNYVKIITLDRGFVPIDLYPFQKEAIENIHNNRFVIVKAGRQVGKCFFINTIVKIRNTKSGEIFETTIGEFYEYISRVSDLQEEYESAPFSHKKYTQDDYLGIYSDVSQHSLGFGISNKQSVKESSRRKEPRISAWREILSFFRKICQGWEARKNIQERDGKKKEKWKLHDNARLLAEENKWQSGISQQTSFKKTIDIFFGEVCARAWRGNGKGNLDRTTSKVVKKFQETKLFKNFAKIIQSNYEKLFFGNSLFCNLGASRYAPVQEQGISFEIEQRKYGDARFYRFGEKENNRIRWGLLAQWSSSEQKERRSKTKNDHERQFFNTKSERTRLQQRSPISNSSMSELSDRVERKFVRSINVSDWEVSSDSGWVPITHIHKTIKYKEWVVKTISGKKLICADDHIVFDAYGNQTFIKNLKPNSTKILTENGPETVISVYETDKESNMFDLTVNSNDHRLYTNGILSHNTTTVVAYLLWYVLFNEDKFVAILANKAKTSREILGRIQLAYEALPLWLQQGVKEWNKGSIELENNCRILADSTSSSAARGYTISFLYLDEFAFVPNNVAEEFFTSVYPTITSGTQSKILISSTPNGMNHFYKMWKEAEDKINGFRTIEANWRQVPGRTEQWALEQKKVLGEQKYLQEMETSFLGSAGTLISAAALKNLTFDRPIRKMLDGLEIYEEPIEGHFYVTVVDASRGQGLDYSAFVTFDTSIEPFKIVAKYRNNTISPMLFPNVIVQSAKYYNDAYLVIENNDVGAQVADITFSDLEYDNMFHGEESNGRFNLTQGRAKQLGVKTTKRVKRQGCNALKEVIENGRLNVQDFNIIEELSTFILKKDGTYAAEEGSHDDLAMCLVLFAWLTSQAYFKDLTNFDIRKKLYEEKMRQIDDELPPLPATSIDLIENPKYFHSQGMVWETVEAGDDPSIASTYRNWLS